MNLILTKIVNKMRNLLTVMVLLLITNITIAQDLRPFIEVGIDGKMAIEGPGRAQDEPNKGTFNGEFKIGVEGLNNRFGAAYETHEAINYEKFSVFFDHKFNKKLFVFINSRKFTTYIGGELLYIKRTWPDAHYSNPNNYRKKTVAGPKLGMNSAIYYSVGKKTGDDALIQIGMNWNVFGAEPEYTKWKKTTWDKLRNDVMVVVKINL